MSCIFPPADPSMSRSHRQTSSTVSGCHVWPASSTLSLGASTPCAFKRTCRGAIMGGALNSAATGISGTSFWLWPTTRPDGNGSWQRQINEHARATPEARGDLVLGPRLEALVHHREPYRRRSHVPGDVVLFLRGGRPSRDADPRATRDAALGLRGA